MCLTASLGLAVILMLALSTACRESASPEETTTAEKPVQTAPTEIRATRSPADVARRLQSLHQQRAYDEIATLVVENQREASIDLLKAIDGVLDANAALRKTAEDRYSGPMVETWDLAAMEDNIGPFSARVRLINQRFKRETSTVTLQAGDNIPLIHARFDLVGSEWQYRPEPTPARMVVELNELACVLRGVEESVRHGAPFESYLDAFLSSVLPQMDKVVTATDEPLTTVAVGDGPD